MVIVKRLFKFLKLEKTQSAIAIIETSAAVLAVFYVTARFNSLAYFGFLTLLSPFLLLRSDLSTEYGAKLYSLAIERFGKYLIPHREYSIRKIVQGDKNESRLEVEVKRDIETEIPIDANRHPVTAWYLFTLSFFFFFCFVISIPIKIISTLRYLFPGLNQIGNNWKRSVFEINLTKPFELVPGSKQLGVIDSLSFPVLGAVTKTFAEQYRYLTFAIVFLLVPILYFWPISNVISTQETFPWHIFLGCSVALLALSGVFRLPAIVIMTIATLFSYVIAVWYRWSLKCTSIVWFPLIFSMNLVNTKGLSIENKLKLARQLSIKPAATCIALFIISLFAFKLALEQGVLAEFATPFSDGILSIYLNTGSDSISRWQLAATINAVLYLVLNYVLIDLFLVKLKAKKLPNDWIESSWRVISFIRGLLSTYTILIFFFTIIVVLDEIYIPVIGEETIPERIQNYLFYFL